MSLGPQAAAPLQSGSIDHGAKGIAVTALLVIIYVAFISLGLPDSIMGSAWPVIRLDLQAPVSLVGYLSMAVSAGTVISSLASSKVVSRFGTAKVTIVSVLMTAAALLGFSLAGHAAWLFLLAIPLGLGAGSVDAALNNFVALHYKSMHMNWLHCFWGVGHRGTDDHVLLSGWRRLAQRLRSHCCAAVCPGGGPVAVPEALAGEGRDQPGWGRWAEHPLQPGRAAAAPCQAGLGGFCGF